MRQRTRTKVASVTALALIIEIQLHRAPLQKNKINSILIILILILTRAGPEIKTVLGHKLHNAAILMQGVVPQSTGTAAAELVFS
jgi:hypothetical protein